MTKSNARGTVYVMTCDKKIRVGHHSTTNKQRQKEVFASTFAKLPMCQPICSIKTQ